MTLYACPGQDLPKLKKSQALVYFDCSCGNKKIQKKWVYFVKGQTKTCGRCNLLPASHWANTKYGKLRMKDPGDFLKSSHKVVTWECDCGRETSTSISRVTSGNTKTCGRCNLLPASHWANTKYGKLRMKDPGDTLSGSGKNVEWECDCGGVVPIPTYRVFRGETTSCGKCNVLGLDHWASSEYGKLRMKDPEDVHSGSNKVMLWSCRCGGEIRSKVFDVFSGKIRSCGKCRLSASNWYSENRKTLLELKTPICPEVFPTGWIKPVRTIEKSARPFDAVCPLCLSIYRPTWNDVRSGHSLTCGCSSNKMSFGQIRLRDIIADMGVGVELEHEVDGYKYDLFVPSKNLLIEYHGLRWHVGEKAKGRDFNKYCLAVRSGHEFMAFYEDELRFQSHIVTSILRNRVRTSLCMSLRPSQTELRRVLARVADSFYGTNHYIGSCRANVNYGVFFDGSMVACCSFKRPTRQSSHDWELVRMASVRGVRVHGIWSKILKQFVSEYHPSTVVSFSDNRLFNGSTYEKLGFVLDGTINPDYFWVKGCRRYHKSSLRKTKEERKTGKTETELREHQGYQKIWDVGKKRWVLTPPC